MRHPVFASLAGAAALLLAALGGTAQAVPPANDTPAGAIEIAPLPFSTTLDASESTAGPADAEVEKVCGAEGFPVTGSVWYAYTPNTDHAVKRDAGDSDYWVALGVVS